MVLEHDKRGVVACLDLASIKVVIVVVWLEYKGCAVLVVLPREAACCHVEVTEDACRLPVIHKLILILLVLLVRDDRFVATATSEIAQ